MSAITYSWKSYILDLASDLTPGAFVSILFLVLVLLIGISNSILFSLLQNTKFSQNGGGCQQDVFTGSPNF